MQAGFAQDALASIQIFVGRHNVNFKNYAHSPGLSFGFKVNIGIYVVKNESYRGALQYTLLEGASNNKDRRKLSEEFELPNPNYDKHIVFKFAQFRSSNIGWMSEFDLGNISLFHQIGFGIFGLTEKSPLFDFSMHNHVGILLGDFEEALRPNLGILYDQTIGTGNPNYDISNIGFSGGGLRNF